MCYHVVGKRHSPSTDDDSRQSLAAQDSGTVVATAESTSACKTGATVTPGSTVDVLQAKTAKKSMSLLKGNLKFAQQMASTDKGSKHQECAMRILDVFPKDLVSSPDSQVLKMPSIKGGPPKYLIIPNSMLTASRSKITVVVMDGKQGKMAACAMPSPEASTSKPLDAKGSSKLPDEADRPAKQSDALNNLATADLSTVDAATSQVRGKGGSFIKAEPSTSENTEEECDLEWVQTIYGTTYGEADLNYTTTFKANVVDFVLESEMDIMKAADMFRVYPELIARWIKKRYYATISRSGFKKTGASVASGEKMSNEQTQVSAPPVYSWSVRLKTIITTFARQYGHGKACKVFHIPAAILQKWDGKSSELSDGMSTAGVGINRTSSEMEPFDGTFRTNVVDVFTASDMTITEGADMFNVTAELLADWLQQRHRVTSSHCHGHGHRSINRIVQKRKYMRAKSYSLELKQRVVAFAGMFGKTKACKCFGIPLRTIHSWMKIHRAIEAVNTAKVEHEVVAANSATLTKIKKELKEFGGGQHVDGQNSISDDSGVSHETPCFTIITAKGKCCVTGDTAVDELPNATSDQKGHFITGDGLIRHAVREASKAENPKSKSNRHRRGSCSLKADSKLTAVEEKAETVNASSSSILLEERNLCMTSEELPATNTSRNTKKANEKDFDENRDDKNKTELETVTHIEIQFDDAVESSKSKNAAAGVAQNCISTKSTLSASSAATSERKPGMGADAKSDIIDASVKSAEQASVEKFVVQKSSGLKLTLKLEKPAKSDNARCQRHVFPWHLRIAAARCAFYNGVEEACRTFDVEAKYVSSWVRSKLYEYDISDAKWLEKRKFTSKERTKVIKYALKRGFSKAVTKYRLPIGTVCGWVGLYKKTLKKNLKLSQLDSKDNC